MKLHVLGCAGGSAPGRQPSSYLVEDRVAVDAGALTHVLPVDDQLALSHVLLTHAHLDHMATLPFLIDNRFEGAGGTLHIHAHAHTLRDLREGVFNDRVWPDIDRLRASKAISIELHEVEPGRPFQVDHLRVTASAMEHPVPCLGFLIEDDAGAVFIGGDTGSTATVKRGIAPAGDRLRALLIEVSWPDRLAELARAVGHLTPASLGAAWPLHPHARVCVTHIKPRFRAEVLAELERLGLEVLVLEDGQILEL